LAPEPASRARVVAHPAGGEGLVDGLEVHPRHHQDLAGVVLLGDGRGQPGCVELERAAHLRPRQGAATRGALVVANGIGHDNSGSIVGCEKTLNYNVPPATPLAESVRRGALRGRFDSRIRNYPAAVMVPHSSGMDIVSDRF